MKTASETTMPATTDADSVGQELGAWLREHWDPELTVAAWWELLGSSGWAVPTWPTAWHGRGLTRDLMAAVVHEFEAANVLGPPGGLGMLLAGPTILVHGTDEQKQRYLWPIVTGAEAWCQLFSEPGAGSDLAGLQAKGVRDGDEWIFNGQKVWTSGGHQADLGMLLARTNVEVPKHAGISYFALSMHQPDAIDVRPLREMTGRALFNEVFVSDARSHTDTLIGGLDNGWAVANTTLNFERAGLGAGGHSAGGLAAPGSVVGDLSRRAGDFVRASRRGTTAGGGTALSSAALVALARERGVWDDATIRQDLMRLRTLEQIGRFGNLRAKAAAQAGRRLTGGEPNMAKLAMSRIVRLGRDLVVRILGPDALLAGPDAPNRGAYNEVVLFSPAPSIYGGSDEVQRNVLGERTLGLPSEPRPDKGVPFKDLLIGTQR